MTARALAAVVGVGLGLAALAAYGRARELVIGSDSDAGGDTLVDQLAAPFYSLGGIMGMRLSPAGLAQLGRREGYSATPYRDVEGNWTIGYGHLILPGESFGSLSELDARELLARDVSDAENAVNALVRVPLAPWQFDALVSFVFNVGAGAFRRSTLLRLLNAGDYAAASGEFRRWRFVDDGSGGKVESPGIASRRVAEAAQFRGLA